MIAFGESHAHRWEVSELTYVLPKARSQRRRWSRRDVVSETWEGPFERECSIVFPWVAFRAAAHCEDNGERVRSLSQSSRIRTHALCMCNRHRIRLGRPLTGCEIAADIQ
jgi:hypothetical protein